MVKKTITYVDFNGNKRTEDFYFNLTKAECLEMELSVNGGLSTLMQRLIDSDDIANAIKIVKDILFRSYGEKSLDGKYFNKSQELSEKFSHTRAYSLLYTELVTDPKAAAEFMNAVVDTDDGNAPVAASPAPAATN